MKRILGAFLVLLATVGCNHSCTQDKNSKFTDWALQNAQKIDAIEVTEKQDDLKMLKQIVGEADVVCLGESRHDLYEQFQLKHRFVKYLIEELNFTSFVLEASLSYSIRLNNYVLNGNGDIDEILSNMPGWFLWDTQVMKEIFQWIYAYNQTQPVENKVNFYGIDIVAPNNALDQIFEYLQEVDKPYFETIKSKNFARNAIVDSHWPSSLQRYAEIAEAEKQIVAKNYHDLYLYLQQNETAYIGKSSKAEYDWILILAYSAREANKMFSEEDRIEMGLIRDNAMANITLWIKERNERLMIWAHNVHITKSEFVMNRFPGRPIQGMGYILNQKFQNKMVSIGASFNEGEFQPENRVFEPAEANTIDGALAKLNMEYFILNLQEEAKDKAVQKWLDTGNVLRGQEFEMSCSPKQSFDAIYFTNTVSKVKYNPSTLERFNN